MVEVSKFKAIKLADLGEGLTEALLVKFLVAKGDHVDLLQAIAQVETEKSVADVTSPYSGRVCELVAKPGEYASVGDILLRLEADA